MKKSFSSYFWVLIAVIVAVPAISHQFSRSVSTFSQSERRKNLPCIILDAGHGGVDGGATSCTGKLESGYNLEIALRLMDLLHLLGYPTRMIRTTDTSVYTKGDTIAAQKMSDLKQRVSIVNASDQNILISIHQNTYSDSRYSGAQVFYPDVGHSRELAQKMQTELVNSLNPCSHRKAKKAEGIYLLDHIENTGILVECGFLSNPEEEARLGNPDYQKKLCCVLAAVTTNFLREEYANT